MAHDVRLHGLFIKTFANCKKRLGEYLPFFLHADIEACQEDVHVLAPLKVGVGPEYRGVRYKDRHFEAHLVPHSCCRLVARIKELIVREWKSGRQEIERREPAGWGAEKWRVVRSRNLNPEMGWERAGEFQLGLCSQCVGCKMRARKKLEWKEESSHRVEEMYRNRNLRLKVRSPNINSRLEF